MLRISLRQTSLHAIMTRGRHHPATPLPDTRTIGYLHVRTSPATDRGPRPQDPSLSQRPRPEAAPGSEPNSKPLNETELRSRTVSTMVSAALLAVVGTLIFAWALRS